MMQANSGDPEQTPRSVASDMDLHCLPLSHKKKTMHIWVKKQLFCYLISVAEIWEADC